MAVEIIMPKLGMGMQEGTVVEWLKKQGEQVEKGESVAVISSDKIEKDIEAPDNGILLKIAADVDDTVSVGKAIGYIGQPGEKIETGNGEEGKSEQHKETAAAIQTSEAPARKPMGLQRKSRISPAARKLAQQEGIDINDITGTGPQGRVTREDVEKAIEKKKAAVEEPQVHKREEQVQDEISTKQVSGMRKVIASRMFSSLQQSAQLTIHMRANVTELLLLRQKVNGQPDSNSRAKVKLTITDFIARAAVLALADHKMMNSTYEGDQITSYHSVHLGMAVALENGLVVPVIKHAERYSVSQLSNEIKVLGKKAREGTLEADQMKGSTFTITSLGAEGVEFFTPILNPPEVGILGAGSIADTPVFVGEEVKRQSMLPLSLTFDHRAIDGVPASRFLQTIKDYLENPYHMLV
ncbi:dihydrolipoamide acetyltransferase family protein [Siminovitchia sp. 179-K 8D1 HS]|uniref:dihydrolipoamide acetyltransferase family protein n=1 Tax=Siminovitchia sp. 179-K 8D1 HS TaxID=3142385 RepID=UPI0039A21CA2